MQRLLKLVDQVVEGSIPPPAGMRSKAEYRGNFRSYVRGFLKPPDNATEAQKDRHYAKFESSTVGLG